MRMEVATARVVKCVITGEKLAYRGYGRPPKYSDEGRKQVEAKKRRDRYAAKKKAEGKTARKNKRATKH